MNEGGATGTDDRLEKGFKPLESHDLYTGNDDCKVYNVLIYMSSVKTADSSAAAEKQDPNDDGL